MKEETISLCIPAAPTESSLQYVVWIVDHVAPRLFAKTVKYDNIPYSMFMIIYKSMSSKNNA